MRTRCNKCVIELCYNSSSTVHVSITDPGMTLKQRDFVPLGSWSLQVIDFISGVVHRYGVPHSIITDNGSNFTDDEVKTWCTNLGIKLNYASVYHPQTNGQVEQANGLIMSGIKPRPVRSVKESNTHWVEELDSVLWGLRTTPNRTTRFTPFFMVYGAEAVLPCDIIHDSPRVRMYEEREAKLDRQDSLDALEEERDVAKAR